MKPLSEEELKKAADEAWECSEHEGIDYLSFIDAFEKGYARCIRQMQDEFDELLKACHTALQNQTNVETNKIINQIKKVNNDQ